MTDIERELRLASRTSPLVVLGKAANEIKRLRAQNAAFADERERCRAAFIEIGHLLARDPLDDKGDPHAEIIAVIGEALALTAAAEVVCQRVKSDT